MINSFLVFEIYTSEPSMKNLRRNFHSLFEMVIATMLFSKNAMLFIQNDIQESGFISGVTKKNCLLTLTQA